jgi:hypothetical protein
MLMASIILLSHGCMMKFVYLPLNMRFTAKNVTICVLMYKMVHCFIYYIS